MSPHVTTNTVFLGFDIGKSEHAFAVVDQNAALLESGKTETSRRSCTAFAKRMVKRYPDLVVGSEATSFYHERIAKTFLAQGLSIRVVNPQLTTTKAIRSSMRNVKSDPSDAEGIAQKLRKERGAIGQAFTWDEEKRMLQAIGRSYNKLLRYRQSLISHVSVYKERDLSSVNAPNAKAIDEEIARMRNNLICEARRIFPKEVAIMVEIDGIGEETAARLLAETMGLDRFKNGHAFAAFVGLDPRVKQSGTSLRGKTSMTKNGSPILRFILGWAAKNVVLNNECFSRRFEADIARGKPPGVAYGSIARRLAVILHVCLTRKVAFDPSLVGTSEVSG